MTNREMMQSLLAGEAQEVTPFWLMSFSNADLAWRLMPETLHYDGYAEYPEKGAYPFSSMGEARLRATQSFNRHILRPVFPVGWGANAAFGHGGPGEFNKRVLRAGADAVEVEYETSARREIRRAPHNVRTCCYPISCEEDLKRLELPDPTDCARYSGFAEDVAWAKAHGEWTVGWVNGFFSGVHYFLRDYAQFCMDLAAEPDFAKALIERVALWNLDAARKMCEAGVDCVGFCDDLGSQGAMMMQPAMYRDLFWPWHRKLCDIAHQSRAAVHMHSHGAILPIVPMLAQAGVDILNPLDPDDRMSMGEVRSAAGHRMVLCGGMNKHFFDWDRHAQAAHLRQVVDQGRRHGPHILMDSGGVPDNVTCETFDAFLSMVVEICGGSGGNGNRTFVPFS